MSQPSLPNQHSRTFPSLPNHLNTRLSHNHGSHVPDHHVPQVSFRCAWGDRAHVRGHHAHSHTLSHTDTPLSPNAPIPARARSCTHTAQRACPARLDCEQLAHHIPSHAGAFFSAPPRHGRHARARTCAGARARESSRASVRMRGYERARVRVCAGVPACSCVTGVHRTLKHGPHPIPPTPQASVRV